MIGLNNIREAYQSVYTQLDERMDPDEREMRRLAAAERRAGNSDRMDPKAASKYADSEKKSAEREDKKSKGKHIHGMADSVELEGDLVDEAQIQPPRERVGALTNIQIPQKERDAARERIRQKTDEIRRKRESQREEFAAEEKNKEGKEQGADGKACWKGYKFAGTKNGKDKCVKASYEPSYNSMIDERALDTAEKGEKERLVTGMKKSAEGFKKRYGARATSVMHATATKIAKKNMDTSQSDRRYAVEETDTEHRTRKPSQIAKREKLNRLLDQIKSKKGEKQG